MGRGRQKAKHQKVARALKYSVPETDYSQLERELSGGSSAGGSEELSKWSDYYEESDDSDDDYEQDVQARRA